MRELREADLVNIIYGSSFFGGGGSMEEGLKLLEEMKKENPNPTIIMNSVSEMPDDDKVVSTMIAALGSPVATKGKTFQKESVNAVKGMMDEARFQGKELKYVYSGEQGGGNTLLPLYAAWKNGLPILDTDGNGRAVPELNTGLAPVYGIPTSPVILASERGDTIVGRTEDPMDSRACETIARYMCQAYDQGIGFAAWMMNKKDHLKASAVGQMSLTMGVGSALQSFAPQGILFGLGEIFKQANRKFKAIIPLGTITAIDITSEGGFDTGVTTIVDDKTKEKFKVVFQNENLYVENPKGEIVVTIPTIISLLDMGLKKETRALSNSETEVGQKVALIAVDAHERWYGKPECYGCWEEIMVSAGYREVGEEVRPNN